MMKKIYLLPILALLPLVSSAQGTIGYSYDAAGNRVTREIVMPVPKAMAKQQTFAADGIQILLASPGVISDSWIITGIL